jgi:hypothetical protein
MMLQSDFSYLYLKGTYLSEIIASATQQKRDATKVRHCDVATFVRSKAKNAALLQTTLKSMLNYVILLFLLFRH